MAKINCTKKYRLFTRSDTNRPLDPKRHWSLLRSMKRFGFLSCYPIVCRRDPNGNLWIIDGQHRLAFAEMLGLAVYWVEETTPYHPADLGPAVSAWCFGDFVRSYAAQGKADYQEALDFHERHGIALGSACALLSGTASVSNITPAIRSGSWTITDRSLAETVASIWTVAIQLSDRCKNTRFVHALIAVCRVKGFEAARLIGGLERCPDRLLSYSTYEANLEMLEQIYNFGRKSLFALKVEALQTMRDRAVAPPKDSGSPPPEIPKS